MNTYIVNENKTRIDILLNSEPTEEMLHQLAAAGFLSRSNKFWFAKYSWDVLNFAKKICIQQAK